MTPCPTCFHPEFDTSEVDDFTDYCKPCRKRINLERWGYTNDTPIEPPAEGLHLSAEELQVIMKGLVTMATPSRQNEAAKVIHAAIARTKKSKAHEWLSGLPELEGRSGVLAWSEPPPVSKEDAEAFDAMKKQGEKAVAQAFYYAKMEGDATPMACSPEKMSRHTDHGQGDDTGPLDSDCPCREGVEEAECAKSGCGFCKSACDIAFRKLCIHGNPVGDCCQAIVVADCEGSGTNV